jgi:hypothetical protein
MKTKLFHLKSPIVVRRYRLDRPACQDCFDFVLGVLYLGDQPFQILLVGFTHPASRFPGEAHIESPGAYARFDRAGGIEIARHDLDERKDLPVIDAPGEGEIVQTDRPKKLAGGSGNDIHRSGDPGPAA